MKHQYTFLKLYGAILDCLVLSDLFNDRGLTLNSIRQSIVMVTFSLCKDYMIYDLIRIMHSSQLTFWHRSFTFKF